MGEGQPVTRHPDLLVEPHGGVLVLRVGQSEDHGVSVTVGPGSRVGSAGIRQP